MLVEGKISKDSGGLTSFQSQAAVTGEAWSLTVEKWMKYLKLERTHFVENLKWLYHIKSGSTHGIAPSEHCFPGLLVCLVCLFIYISCITYVVVIIYVLTLAF